MTRPAHYNRTQAVSYAVGMIFAVALLLLMGIVASGALVWAATTAWHAALT